MPGIFYYILYSFSFHFFNFLIHNKEIKHPIYVAVAEVEYNNSDKFATVVCKTFSDDLNLALQKQYHKIENFDNPENIKALSSEIEEYVKKHLQLKLNGKEINLVYTSFKKEENTILSYFRINNINGITKVEINDTIFYELYDKQMQIVYITVNGNRKNNRIVNPESKLAFDF